MKLLLDISFLGTAYHGYQVQPNVPTVQEKLNFAAKSLFGVDCDIVGCSRTDSGVHAKQFFAAVTQKGKDYISTDIMPEKIALALSAYLPADISVNSVSFVNDSFHPRYDVKQKEYMYCIWNSKSRNPFMTDRAWHYSREISDMAFENMRLAAREFVGTHDFSSYMAANTKICDTVRTVYDTRIEREDALIRFYITGNGFLYNMVRIIVGTLIAVAENRIGCDDIVKITEAHDRSLAGVTAPPQGLYLNRVIY